ncbi:Nonribosomal peptide synthetase ACTTS1 [Paramyrothecium foliicola]|nr:Nonribosomal peptide synthetase ACTTS1 [Paramyrothecium foliicola]
MAPIRTEPRYSLLGMDDDELKEFLDTKLEEVNIDNLADVEDIYPCAPIQEGIQLSKMNISSPDYNVVATISIDPVSRGGIIDLDIVRHSWQQVVNRHPILRTVLVETVEYDRLVDQIVLAHHNADIQEVAHLQDCVEPLRFPEDRPAHRLTICSMGGRSVHCQLEIDHTLTDGLSIAIIMRDLSRAYKGQLSLEPLAEYKDYIAFLQREDRERHLCYWKQRLSGLRPCLFPIAAQHFEDGVNSIQLACPVPGLRSSILQAVCRKLNVTLFNLVQAAWALVLRSYTGMDDVCFGYVTSGRDLPVKHVNEIVGPLINTLVCRAHLGKGGSESVSGLVQDMQKQFLENSEHQITSLGDIHGVLHLRRQRLFNTAVIFRPLHLDSIGNDTISLNLIGRKSFTEFDITVSLERADKVAISLHYSPHIISEENIKAVAQTLSETLAAMPGAKKTPRIKPSLFKL